MSRVHDKSVTSPAQLAAIRRQVRTGRYRVDPERVATALLTGADDRRRSTCLIRLGR